MNKVRTFDEFVNEKLNISKKKWMTTDLADIPDETLDILWKMYEDSYKKEGLDLSADGPKELQGKYKAAWFIDVDGDKEPDAFIIYKVTPFGNKMALMGSDGTKEAKSLLVKYFISLIKTKGWFIEASAKMEELCKSINAPVEMDETKIKAMLNKPIEWGEDGYYTRKLRKVNKTITKRVYGQFK